MLCWARLMEGLHRILRFTQDDRGGKQAGAEARPYDKERTSSGSYGEGWRMNTHFDSKGPRGAYAGRNEEELVAHLICELRDRRHSPRIECLDEDGNRYVLIDCSAVMQATDELERYLKLLQAGRGNGRERRPAPTTKG